MGTSPFSPLPPLPAADEARYHLGWLVGAMGRTDQPLAAAVRELAPEYRRGVALLAQHLIDAIEVVDDYVAVDDGRLGAFGSPSNDGGYSAD